MGCNGPDSTKWDGETCISAAQQTSCDSINETTCFYADLEIQGLHARGLGVSTGPWFGGQFVKKGADSGDFRVDLPGPLAALGVQAGDVVCQINGRKPTGKALLLFTPKDPARRVEVTRTSVNGFIKLSLYRK